MLCCKGCTYAANTEKADSIPADLVPGNIKFDRQNVSEKVAEIFSSIDDVVQTDSDAQFFFNEDSGALCILIVPSARALNTHKLQAIEILKGCKSWKPSSSATVGEINVIIDSAIDISTAAKTAFSIYRHSMISAHEGDWCVPCSKTSTPHKLGIIKAIEVGHTFYLGKKYSSALDASYLNAVQTREHIEMGCYGLGVSRIMAAIVETNNDESGIKWPPSISPYSVAVLPVYKKSCERGFNNELEQRVVTMLGSVPAISTFIKEKDAVLDDRDLSFGYKMKDAALVGYAYVVIAGKSFLKDGSLEIQSRFDGRKIVSRDVEALEAFIQSG